MDVSTVVSQCAALSWMGMGDNAQGTMQCYALTIVRKHVAILPASAILPYATRIKYAVKVTKSSLGAAHLGVSVTQRKSMVA